MKISQNSVAFSEYTNFKARGGNAANNCTVLAQILSDVTFLGTLPKPTYGNQYDFVVNDFEANNVKVSECCPIRHGDSWPEAVVIISKGQLISECYLDLLNFPKNQRKI